MIPIYQPYLPKKSVEYANEAIQSNWISSLGKYTFIAAEKLAEVTETKYCVLTNNGTSATHLVTKSLKKKYPNVKKIYVPSSCFVAAYNCLLYDNIGWEIEAVDLCNETWNADYSSIEPEKNSAIMVVHNLGNIVDVLKLKEKFEVPIIEDNCEGFFGKYRGHQSGSKSLASSLSFFGNKNITTGEGGAFLTNDEALYDYANKIRGQGQTVKRYIHDDLGYNYRMTNVHAAILLGQLESMDSVYDEKMRVFERYKNNLKSKDGIELQSTEDNTEHSMWMNGVKFNGLECYEDADKYFTSKGIETRPMFYPFDEQSHLRTIQGPSENARNLSDRIVIFPSYPELKNTEIDYICSCILKFREELE
tara:strand:+ start:1303 stop:2391 length:1089 start_codon:yes stop_codon:yes gene_type:complete